MIKKLFRYFYYSILDLFKIFINLKSKHNFIILFPRIISLVFKRIIIFDKTKKNFFFQSIRNYSDILTVYEIFSEENYNLKVFKHYEDVKKEYSNILESKKSPLIIDCGSNIGSSSVYFNKIFPISNIVSIEPDKNSYEFSKKNINFNNSLLINKAVNCEKNIINFFSDPKDNRASKVVDDSKESVKSITINEIINDIENNNNKPFLIKIDIEGFENKLFLKNYEWINEFKIIIIEIHDWMLPNKSNSFNFLNAIVKTMYNNNKRDLLILDENLISIRIDE
jgi:FkbM family methyltransferase